MPSAVPTPDTSATLAKDRLGIPAVMFFILSAILDEPRTSASDGTGNHEDPIAGCPW